MKLERPKIGQAILMGLALLTLSACSQQPVQNAVACDLPASQNVQQLFDAVASRLETPACHYDYPSYRERLLSAAKASPGPENEPRFAALLRQSIDRGVISKRQGQEFFSNYFDAEFYVVKAEPRNSCSALHDKQTMYQSMRAELELKREGMLEILADKQRFYQAQHHYTDLHQVFDAVEVACNEEV